MIYARYTGFIGYGIILWLVTGLLMLQLDVKSYALAKMNKEKSVARILGWLNVVFGVLFFVANWALRKWFW